MEKRRYTLDTVKILGQFALQIQCNSGKFTFIVVKYIMKLTILTCFKCTIQ